MLRATSRLTRSLLRSSAPSRNFCLLNKDCELTYNRHQRRIVLHNFRPKIVDERLVSASAVIMGEVGIMAETTVGDFTVIRGDLNFVNIRGDVCIGPNVSISTVSDLDRTGQEARVHIDNRCLILPGASLVSCRLEAFVAIGANSVVCEGVRIGRDSVIGNNSVVPPYRYIPAGQLWAGNPVRFVKDLSKQEIHALRMMVRTNNEVLGIYDKDKMAYSNAYLEKEMLDDLEMILASGETTKEGLESALETIEAMGMRNFFTKDLIRRAEERAAISG